MYLSLLRMNAKAVELYECVHATIRAALGP